MHTFVRLMGRHVPVLPASQRRRCWVELGDGLHLPEFPAVLVPYVDRTGDSQTLILALHLSDGQILRFRYDELAPRLNDCLLRAVECTATPAGFRVTRCLFELGRGAAKPDLREPLPEARHA